MTLLFYIYNRNLQKISQLSKVVFVKRQTNMVAHSLARVVIVESCSQVFTSIPSCIATFIMNEMQ